METQAYQDTDFSWRLAPLYITSTTSARQPADAKAHILPVTPKSMSADSSASYHNSKFAKSSNGSNFTLKIWSTFSVSTLVFLHFSALSLNQKPPEISQPPSKSKLFITVVNSDRNTNLPKCNFMDSPACYQTSVVKATEFLKDSKDFFSSEDIIHLKFYKCSSRLIITARGIWTNIRAA